MLRGVTPGRHRTSAVADVRIVWCRSRASPRSDAASPESITTDRGYGFRAPSLRSGPGMTDRSVGDSTLAAGLSIFVDGQRWPRNSVDSSLFCEVNAELSQETG